MQAAIIAPKRTKSERQLWRFSRMMLPPFKLLQFQFFYLISVKRPTAALPGGAVTKVQRIICQPTDNLSDALSLPLLSRGVNETVAVLVIYKMYTLRMDSGPS